MSNHEGEYILNNVLMLLDDLKILDKLDDETKSQLMNRLVDIGKNHDCNKYKIISNFEDYFGVCKFCFKEGILFDGGLCSKCYSKSI